MEHRGKKSARQNVVPHWVGIPTLRTLVSSTAENVAIPTLHLAKQPFRVSSSAHTNLARVTCREHLIVTNNACT